MLKKTRFLKHLIFRNNYCRNGKKAAKKKVNLEYFADTINLGDALAPIIYNWMLNKKGISPHKRVSKTKHIMTVGSVIGGGYFDSVIWGSGIMSFTNIAKISKCRYFQKFDIRAVRGPITKSVLSANAYDCPDIYGDPAILMPLIYKGDCSVKSAKYGVILHFLSDLKIYSDIKIIDIKTADYKKFIDEICSVDKVISSSLHGIILAETYGIPAVFLCKDVDSMLLKYYDWYYSTGRYNVRMAKTLEEALNMDPMPLPDLSKMQIKLLESFPYDLWDS